MKKYYLLIIFSLSLLINACARGESVELYDYTCQEFWDYLDVTSNNEDRKEDFLRNMISLWNYSVSEFEKEYPDLKGPNIVVIDENEKQANNPYFIMEIFMACPKKPENSKKILGSNIQENFYKIASKQNQKQLAHKEGCRIFPGPQARLFAPENFGFLSICGPEEWNVKGHVVYDERNTPIGMEICKEISGVKENCKSIKPTKENFCLSQFGDCMKVGDSECGWQHTVESRKCSVQ